MQRQEKRRKKASCYWTGSRLSTSDGIPAINLIDLMEMILFWHNEWYILIANIKLNSSSAGIGNKKAIETLQKQRQGIKKGHNTEDRNSYENTRYDK